LKVKEHGNKRYKSGPNRFLGGKKTYLEFRGESREIPRGWVLTCAKLFRESPYPGSKREPSSFGESFRSMPERFWKKKILNKRKVNTREKTLDGGNEEGAESSHL